MSIHYNFLYEEQYLLFKTSSYPPSNAPPSPPLLSDLKYTSNITLIISIHTALTLNLNQSSVKTFKLVYRAPKMSKVHNRFKRTMPCHIFHKKKLRELEYTVLCTESCVNVNLGVRCILHSLLRSKNSFQLDSIQVFNYLSIYIIYISIYLFISLFYLSIFFCKSVTKEICRFEVHRVSLIFRPKGGGVSLMHPHHLFAQGHESVPETYILILKHSFFYCLNIIVVRIYYCLYVLFLFSYS